MTQERNARSRNAVSRRMIKAIAIFMTASVGMAQVSPAQIPPAHVVSHGEGVVSARPDQVRIQIGVTTQAPTANEAGQQNAKQSAAVIAELKQQIGNAAEFQTMNYSLYPTYRTQRDGSKPTIAGYQANNTVEVKLNDVALAGKTVDFATKSGANQIQGVNFSMRDEQKLRVEALAKAATQARANVQALASAVGLRVHRIVKVEDGEPVRVIPMRMEMMKAQDAAQTPVEPGEIQVRATVTITAEVTP
jgi:uncharacterized protein YggE